MEGEFYMKNARILAIVLLGIMMTVGFIFIGCKDDDGGGNCPAGNCYYRNDYNWEFCGRYSCPLADDYYAKCNC